MIRGATLLLAALVVAACGGPIFPPLPATPGPSPGPTADLYEPHELGALVAMLEAQGATKEKPSTITLTDGDHPVWLEHVGVVDLPTGRAVASDIFYQAQPFMDRLTVRNADVTLVVVALGPNDHTNAAAVLGPTEGIDALRWRPAAQEAVALRPDDLAGFAVDSGTAMFVSAEGAEIIAADQHFADEILPLLNAAAGNVLDHKVAGDRLHLIALPSGIGDGWYPVWVGDDRTGTPRTFVVDFAILDRALQQPAASPTAGPSSVRG